MTDQLFDIHQSGGPGRSPITPAGRVAYNVRLDQKALERRKVRKDRGCYPGASTDDSAFFVLPRDLLLTEVRRAGRRSGDGLIPVFSVLNGAGTQEMSYVEFIEGHAFAGFSSQQTVAFSTTGKSPRNPEFATVLGGLVTVWNTGGTRIENGQKLYWDVPMFGTNVTERHRRESHRITPILRAYDPAKQGITARTVIDAMRDRRPRSSSSDEPVTVPKQAAIAIKSAAVSIALNTFDMLLSSGLVQFDQVALGNDDQAAAQRIANAGMWRRQLTARAREGHITRVAGWLGSKRVNDASGVKLRVPHLNEPIRSYFVNLLAGDDDDHRLIALTEGRRSVPSGNAGEIVRNQRACVQDLIAGVAKADHFVKRRILGTALTPSDPGKEGDIVLGHYMS